MPRPANPSSTRGLVLRSFGFAVAVALGVISVWLIVTRSSVTGQRIGALAGFWGLLLGASALSVGRRTAHPEPVEERPAAPSAEIALRTDAAVERAAEAEARREFEAHLTARLEGLMRQELQQTFGQEIHQLRSEIASLRSELVEKVGGQLRLERIETTRVIGSDLEALQHEVRQLKDARDATAFSGFGTARTIEAARPVLEPVPPPPPAPAVPDVARATASEETGPIRPPAARVDDFAALPRLTPFTEFELDLLDAPPAGTGRAAERPGSASSYRGRRRADDDPPADHDIEPESAPRHAGAAADQQLQQPGRRHRHADDDDAGPAGSAAATTRHAADGQGAHGADGDTGGYELLARLLHREGAR